MNSSLQILIHNKFFVKKITLEYARRDALITNAFLEILKLMNKEEYTYNNTSNRKYSGLFYIPKKI